MKTLEEIGQELSRKMKVAHLSRRQTMLTGRRTGPNLYDVTLDGAPTNQVWVRAFDASREETPVWGVCNAPNIEVEVDYNTAGERFIVSPSYSLATQTAGDGLFPALQPLIPPGLFTGIIEGEQFGDGLVTPPDGGGLAVRIRSFAHKGGFWQAQDVPIDDPAAANTQAWVLCGVLQDTNAATYYVGDAYPLTFPMTKAQLADISVADGFIPCGAVLIRNGQTEVTARDRFVRWSYFLEAAGDGGSIAVSDGTTTVDPVTLVNLDPTFFDVTDGGSDDAQVTFVGEASEIPYTPTSPLTATDVQGALDELAAGGGGGGGDVVVTRALKTTQTQLWRKTNGSTATFDTNNADDTGRTAPNWTGYDYLIVRMRLKSDVTANNDGGALWLNNDTTAANYRTGFSIGAAAGALSMTQPANNTLLFSNGAGAGGSPTDTWTDNEVKIFDVNSTTAQKNMRNIVEGVRSSTQLILGMNATWWQNTAAVTRLTAVPITGTGWVAGSYMEVVGVKEEYVVSNVTGGVLGGSVDMAALSLDATPALTDTLMKNDGTTTNDKSTIENTLHLYDNLTATLTNKSMSASQVNSGVLTAGRAVAEITTTSTGNIDDFAIGTAPVTLLRMNNASDATLRGMAAGVGGQVVIIESVGAGNVFLAHQNAGSSAVNRLINTVTAASTPLAAGKGKTTYVYDPTTQRWRLASHEQGGYIPYTTSWTGTGSNPTVGTGGTLSASYQISGVYVEVSIALTIGTGFSPGSGFWYFTLPFTLPAFTPVAFFTMDARDMAPSFALYPGQGILVNGTQIGGYNVSSAGAVGRLSPTVPHTWASTDTLALAARILAV